MPGSLASWRGSWCPHLYSWLLLFDSIQRNPDEQHARGRLPDGALYYPASQKPQHPQICRCSKSPARRELGVREGQPGEEIHRTSITPALLPLPSPGYRVGDILQARTEPMISGAPGMGMDRDVTGFLHPSFLGLFIIKARSLSLTSVLLATTIFLVISPPWV